MAKINRPEDAQQRALFQWATLIQTIHGPLRDFMFAIPNGGKRSKVEAAIMKALGVTAGVSDVFVMLPALYHGRHCGGMFIELKAGFRPLSDAQEAFMKRAAAVGYWVGWFNDWEVAAANISQYLSEGGLYPSRSPLLSLVPASDERPL